MSGSPIFIEDGVYIHRVGGSVDNLALKEAEKTLNPPGISTLQGGSPAEAAWAMRRQFPKMAPKDKTLIGTTTAGKIRKAGFDVIMNATSRFPQHARLIHPNGAEGFSRENLERLALGFENHSGL